MSNPERCCCEWEDYYTFGDEDDDTDTWDEDDDEWPFDCAMDRRHGQCGKAGSEECDFECPIMLAIHRAAAAKRAKKATR